MVTERLVEFSFASRLAGDLAPAQLMRLARQSWGDNTRLGVTGVMRLHDRRIEQVCEGPSVVILALAARILTDMRHREIEIRAFGPIPARRFADWRAAGFEASAAAMAMPGAAPGALRLHRLARPPRPAPLPLAARAARAT